MRVYIMVFLGMLLVGATVQTVRDLTYSKFEKKHYLTKEEKAFIRPGLHIEVLATEVELDQVSVTFKITDDKGAPLDIEGIVTPGEVSARFVLGFIPKDGRQYRSVTNRTVTSQATGVTAVQPTADRGGDLVVVDEGVYRYTFGTPLPEDDDPEATHSVGMYLTRDLTEYGLDEEVVNEVVHFLPSGGMVENIREVTLTESCNNCHDPLQIHGGARRDVDLCIMCHTQDVIDPDTGANLDFPVMIHKIHHGSDLPSVQGGTPYQIIGFRGSVHDYSSVVFPRDIRNCETCHAEGASQFDAYLSEPNRDSCGSCHDDVNFATGTNHVGLPQPSDMFCDSCHFPEGELEFDASILGAHTIPAKSRQLEGIQIDILGVTGVAPGASPTVSFTLKNDAGEDIQPMDLAFFNFILAGPTTDYALRVSERAVERALPTDDGFEFTFGEALPEDATGTFTIGAEAFRNVLLNPGTEKEFSFRETAENPVHYFAVTDPEPIPRRAVVSDQKCETCHENLSFHGTIRHDPEYCVTCHHPAADDSARRPEEAFPARNIDFKFLIHRIHMGEELAHDFTVYGFGGNPINFNGIVYPGDLRNCQKCHVDETYQVPSQGVLPTIAEREFYSPIPPNSAACVGCHDSLDAAAHTFLNTAPFGESCGVCHGNGADFDVSKVHARP